MNEVQKIRNEVERLQNELIQEREKGYGSDVDDACISELQNVLTYIDSLQEEPVSEDLNIMAREYSLIEGTENIDEYAQYDFKKYNSFRDGAKWQKEQLMKDAIDGEVGYWNLRGLSVNVELPRSVEEGDKVKVIVIKEN